MSEIWLLTRGYLRQHPTRFLLTCLAMAASACMVIWVVSGYDALLKGFKDFSEAAQGRYTLIVYPVPDPASTQGGIPVTRSVPEAVVKQLQADPALVQAEPMWSARARVGPFDEQTFRRTAAPTTRRVGAPGPATRRTGDVPSSGPAPAGPPRGGVMLIGTNASAPPYDILRGRWIDPSRPDTAEAALSAEAAERMGIDIGGFMSAGTGEHQQKLTVVGIINNPRAPGGAAARGPAGGGMYVPIKLMEKITNRPAEVSFVSLITKDDTEVTAFRFGWQPRLHQSNPPLQFQNSFELEEELDNSATAKNMLMQAYWATGISMLAALFIIFTTLSMGVSERARQFAVLRAIGLTRGKIAGLIAVESLLLGVLGWLGGVAAGYGLLALLRKTNPGLLGDGALLGRWSLLLSAACAFGGALTAAIVPSIRAMRQRPLDALAPQQQKRTGKWVAVSVAAGAVLIAINPLLVFALPLAAESRQALYFALGCTTMGLGFILLAPLAVVMAEKMFGRLLAMVLGLEPRLLKSQLTINMWRTVGTSVALSVGLGLFVAVQVWGYTMLKPFVPGPWIPDVMLGFLPYGLPRDSTPYVAKMPGIDGSSLLPLAVEQVKLTDDITGSAVRPTVTRQDNVIMIGLDPDKGLGGANPVLKLDWVEGSPETVIPLLKKGRYVVVPQHFCHETGLKVGDSFKVNPPSDNSMPVSYTIAGTVRLDGWHWLSKFSGLRLNTGRSSAIVFTDYDSASADFNVPNNRFYWARATAPVDKEAMSTEARKVAEIEVGDSFALSGSGFPSADRGLNVRVTTPQDVTQRVTNRADGWIWGMSKLPLVTLIVSSIGVLNSILASVRARTWDMGVLRALGFTRWTLVRLVMAEGILVGLIACVLSLGFGVTAGWCAAGISQHISFFGGLNPSLVIPWSKLWLGLGGAVGLCFLAALWPAISVGRTEVLKLLQVGRSAI